MNHITLEYRIRSFFLKIDPRDYFFSSLLKIVYKIITINKFIDNFKKKKIKKKFDSDLICNGFTRLDVDNNLKQKIYIRSDEIFKSKEFEENANTRKNYLNQYKIDISKNQNHIYLKFILSNEILNIIKGYLGSDVVLSNLQLWYSNNQKFVSGGSQNLHMDGEDAKQIKMFFYLSDVDEQSGPLCVISKTQSKILNKIKNKKKFIQRKTKKISDNEFQDISNNIKIHSMIGPKGSLNLIDTSNCYHFGSRPGKNTRYLLMYQFLSSYSYYLPIKKNNELKINNSKILDSNEIELINNLLY